MFDNLVVTISNEICWGFLCLSLKVTRIIKAVYWFKCCFDCEVIPYKKEE